MKRLALSLVVLLGCTVAVAATTAGAQAGLFGLGAKKATPSPSPSPSALPTASPEPPSVAIPRLQAKLKANPNDQQAMAELAGEFLEIDRPDMTLGLTQHLLQAGDKSAQVYYLDGVAQEQIGNLQPATYDLEQASTLDPTNMGILAELAQLYLKENRASDAERVANRAVVFNKTQPAALMTLGSVYAAEQKYDDARAEFEAAYELNEKDVTPIFQIASTYAQQDNIPMALQEVHRALAIDPHNVQALMFRADLYARQHDDTRASEAFDDAAIAAPTDDQKVQILVQKAAYFISEKKNAQGEAIFQQIVSQYPKVAGGFVAYGNYWAAQHQWAKAIAQWNAALAVDPQNPGALLGLGQVSMQGGKTQQAIDYLKRYVQVSPDAQGYALLGQAYSQVHDYGNMRDACGRSFEIAKAPETLGCVAGADYELKNYKEAAQIFDALDRGAKGFLDQSPQLLYIAAKSYAGADECGKAVAAYKRLLPMMRKGTKDYAKIKQSAQDPCKAEPRPAKRGGRR
jgi:tetratricopeptide (TPR) repeat protein